MHKKTLAWNLLKDAVRFSTGITGTVPVRERTAVKQCPKTEKGANFCQFYCNPKKKIFIKALIVCI